MAQIQTLSAPFAAPGWTRLKRGVRCLDAMLERLEAVWNRFQAWRDRRATQSVLLSLDDAVLRDIGLNRSEIPSLVFDGYEQRRRVRAARSLARSY